MASTQTLVSVGQQAQTWPSAAALALMTLWLQLTVLATQLGMALVTAQPSGTNMA